MASTDRQRAALQVIYSFFLGLMITAFIGVGVYTFYPSPDRVYGDQMQELYRQEEDILGYADGKGTESSLTEAEKAKLADIREERRELEDKQQAYGDQWARNTSIVLIIFATAVMGVSLIRSEQLRILGNGLLLGGLFTMLYGVGWVIASSSSVARFAVMTFALLITLGLGYVRFVRQREEQQLAVAGGGVATAGLSTAELGSLEQRVEALEARAAAAAAALSGERARD